MSKFIKVVLCSSIFIKISEDLDSSPVLAKLRHSIEVFYSKAFANSLIPLGSALISKLLTFYKFVKLFPSKSITLILVFSFKSYATEAHVSGPN